MVRNHQCYVGNVNTLWALFMIGEIARMSPGYSPALPPMSSPLPRVPLGAEDVDARTTSAHVSSSRARPQRFLDAG